MSKTTKQLDELQRREYRAGFVTNIEQESAPPGLDADIVRFISAKKSEPEWLLAFRLKALRHFLTQTEPRWANVTYGPIDYQAISYYAAPKLAERPKSLAEVDPELLRTYERLGVPLSERELLAGVAVDAVFDSVSVATTFKEKLQKMGIIFCSFSEAVQEHPELVRKYVGSVVPLTDNFFASLNSAVFSDGSFAYVPKGVRCPMELSTYFRINAAKTGQFERTLIIADEGAYVSYLEGCLPPWEEVSCGGRLRGIREVALHDALPDGCGVKTEVAKIMRRGYRGDLVEIEPESRGNRFQLTPNHPVRAIRRDRAGTEPEYVRAGELKDGDLLVFPVQAVEEGDSSHGRDDLRRLGREAAQHAVTIADRELAFQVQELCARQGFFVTIDAREDGARGEIHVIARDESGRTIRRDGYFLVPVRSARREPYHGCVYNLETASEPHSYLVKGFAVHNCTAPMRDENQLHAAVVELVAHDDAQIRYSTVQNWYPGDKEGRGGIFNFVTKRGKCAGRRSKISWTQVETGSAITWKYPGCILLGDDSVGEFYSVATTNNRQQADTGTKMIHIGKNTRSTIISKGISMGYGKNTYRGLVRVAPSADNARNYSQCDSLLIGDKCGAHTVPHVEVQNSTARLEHEATTSRIGEDQLFYCRSRGINPEDAVNLIVNGFCKQVFKELPMEFAVEAQKLLGLQLEGAVG